MLNMLVSVLRHGKSNPKQPPPEYKLYRVLVSASERVLEFKELSQSVKI